MSKEELDTKGFKVGDIVNFVVETSLFTGNITRFYKNCFDEVECSVRTEFKTFSHILLHRIEKVESKKLKRIESDEFVDILVNLITNNTERSSNEMWQYYFDNLHKKYGICKMNQKEAREWLLEEVEE